MRFFSSLCAMLVLAVCLMPLFRCSAAAPASDSPLSLPGKNTPAAPATSAASMALLDPSSGIFLAEENATERRPMASTTKIMTALVILENCPMEECFSVPAEAVGIEGSSVYLYKNEKVCVKTLLYALLLSSANDAAAALAIHAAGSISSFADMMNQKADSLGLTDTHFENPHGLPADGHYTTARDLAVITAYAMSNSTFREIVSTRRYSVPQEGTDAARLFLNHNRLLSTYDGAIGVKTGFTKESGRCLVSAAERDGLCLIAVTLNDGNDWRDHTALFDWGFSNFVSFVPDDTPITMPIVGGSASAVSLLPATKNALTLPATHGEITRTIYAPRFLYGGCEAGTEIGKVVYRCDGEELISIPLIATETVEPAKESPSLLQKILRLFQGNSASF